MTLRQQAELRQAMISWLQDTFKELGGFTQYVPNPTYPGQQKDNLWLQTIVGQNYKGGFKQFLADSPDFAPYYRRIVA